LACARVHILFPPLKRLRFLAVKRVFDHASSMMLRSRHPFSFDDRVKFEEENHTYFVDGVRVGLSVTSLIKSIQTEPFDGNAIIAKNLQMWRNNASSKYHELVTGLSDEEAVKAVKHLWTQASLSGTRMHAVFEKLLNEEPILESETINFRHELSQLKKILQNHQQIEVLRTELRLFASSNDGAPLVAGSIDVLLHDKDDSGLIVGDFKRTSKNLSSTAENYGKFLNNGLPDTDHFKYSLQLWIYAVIFESLTNLAVKQCMLFQVHPDLDEGRVIECTDLKHHAQRLLVSVGVALKNK
jgi:ATP-dependent exoDNAse (exonuclease V) beta subunit